MGIAKKWSRLNAESVARVADAYGVYELADRAGHIIYAGQGRLRERLNHHRAGRDSCTRDARFFRTETTGSKARAEQRERALLRDYQRSNGGRLPRCNERLG